MLKDKLGDKIRKIRKSKGLTQKQLADKIGIDNKHLSRIEKGLHMPTYKILKNIAAALEFDIYEIENKAITDIKQPDQIYLKSLSILNSAKTEKEKKYYLEILRLAQKGLKIRENY